MNTVRHLDLTIIMPVAPGANPKPAIEALRRSIPRGVDAELITVIGKHPTRQRNVAALRARGRILWFLDHDATPDRHAAGQLLSAMRDARVSVAGGPNVAASARTPFERRSAAAIASMWGSPLVQDRYRSRGAIRPAGERSLILCNLMVRRDDFVAAGGFDPRLYPNEENELMNRLAALGRLFRHVPDAVVRKPRPARFGEFVREAYRYGRGRAQQVWISPGWADVARVLGAGAVFAMVILGFMNPWHALAAAGLVGVLTLDGVLLLHVPAGLSLGAIRILAYSTGMSFGFLSGWRTLKLRLTALPVEFQRLSFGSGRFRISESSSFDLGSITMKGAFRHA